MADGSSAAAKTSADRRTTSQMGPHDRRGGTPAPACDGAPCIYSELASAWGVHDGVAALTLEASRLVNTADGVRKDLVTVAHLRMSVPAMLQLRDAIDEVEKMARKQSEARPN